MIKQTKSRKWSFTVVIPLEAFNLFDVVDVVLDFLELRESFSRNNIAQILLELHGQLDSVKRIKSMISKGTLFGNT